MAPKPKSKAEEALQFLDDLDFSVDDVPPASPPPSSPKVTTTTVTSDATSATSIPVTVSNPAPVTSSSAIKKRVSSEAGPRKSTDSRRSIEASRKSGDLHRDGDGEGIVGAGKEAEDALKFLDGE